MACTDDTNSVLLSVSDGELSADLNVAGSQGLVPNALTVDANGVFAAGADGWFPLPSTLTATGSPTGNMSQYTTSADLRTLLSPGAQIKFTQNGIVHHLIVVTVSATTLTLYLEDGTTVDSSAITLPSFSVASNPAGDTPAGGPLPIDTGDDLFVLYASGSAWKTQTFLAWAAANAAAMTRTSSAYANMTAAGYTGFQLPFRGPSGQGLTWQFRWTGGLSYAAGQTAAGVRLTVITADAAGAGGAQDTTNIFAEQTTFTANAELWHDSGWVAINPGVAVKDYLVIMPQFKSDGTRTVTVSPTDSFSVRARLVI